LTQDSFQVDDMLNGIKELMIKDKTLNLALLYDVFSFKATEIFKSSHAVIRLTQLESKIAKELLTDSKQLTFP
jgi:hypothetical protein